MLLNQYGERLKPKRDGVPDYREIATIDTGRDITRTWLMPLLQTQDEVLLGRGKGDLKLYEDIFRDAQARTCVSGMQADIVSRQWHVRPGKARFREESEADRKAADFAKEALESIPWDQITLKKLYANRYGYAGGENMGEQ
ncbi:MAG: phage portal protein family protein, partial [Microcoleus sp.]